MARLALRCFSDIEALLLFVVFLLTVPRPVLGSETKEIVYVYGTNSQGVTRQLAADRTPALYTSDFGDCLGDRSAFDVTIFDAAYYADNMTVVFHLDGTSRIHNESTMLVITLDAYGETRYAQTFDPCLINMWDLCPLTASVPMMVYGSFALNPLQTAAIPGIALQIPDFDGSISLQIFANSTRKEIGCFQAAMTNGNSVGIPDILAPTVAAFVAVAIICSFATASYGISVPLMRAHYAHSLSVALVLETLQAIFLTGALSLHWPSVLVAWWSNFAWSAGLLRISPLVAQVGRFAGVTGSVGLAKMTGPMFVRDGGTQLADQIYGPGAQNNGPVLVAAESLARRKVYNSSNPYDYTWGGDPVLPGVPLPGTWQSLSGTIGVLGIPGASALTVCLVWTVLVALLFPAALLAMKGLLELLARARWIRQDGMAYFRTHALGYARQGMLRVLLVAFPPLTTLAVFQFKLHSSPGSTALAAIVLAAALAGLVYCCAEAIQTGLRRRHGTFGVRTWSSRKGPILTTRKTPGSKCDMPFLDDSANGWQDKRATRSGVHQDDQYIRRFGWLAARYKAKRFWFFAVHLGTQLARSCILGAGADGVVGSGPPTAQLVVLLFFETAVLVLYACWQPLESRRNAALGVWVLGLGRIVVAALCIGLLPQAGISRIGATVLGFVVIVVQVVMLAAVVALVTMGVVSTWLSLTRNQDNFSSDMFFSLRKWYLETLLASATGGPPPPTRRQRRRQEKASRLAELEAERMAASLPPPEPSFHVLDVRRAPKIEDVHGDEAWDSELDNFAHGYLAGASSGGSPMDTVNDLGDLAGPDPRRRGEVGVEQSRASLVGTPIYDPARVLAPCKRSRRSSVASSSALSTLDGIRRVSEMAARSDLSLTGPPQIAVFAGRRSASPFGRSSSAPPGKLPDVLSDAMRPAGRTIPAATVLRMTPTRKTLQRHMAERQSLQTLRSTPVPDAVYAGPE